LGLSAFGLMALWTCDHWPARLKLATVTQDKI